jgi:osmotically inducible lipoprotein OsmB
MYASEQTQITPRLKLGHRVARLKRGRRDETVISNYLKRGVQMKNIKKTLIAVAAVAMVGLQGCAGMNTQQRNTAIGAGVGAVGGAVLTGGSPVGTVGGAALGGLIGHETSKR